MTFHSKQFRWDGQLARASFNAKAIHAFNILWMDGIVC